MIPNVPWVPKAPPSLVIPKNTPGCLNPWVPCCPIAIYGSSVPPTIAILAFGYASGGVPTLIVFFTNDSSKIANLAATKKSCSPKYCQPPASISPSDGTGE